MALKVISSLDPQVAHSTQASRKILQKQMLMEHIAYLREVSFSATNRSLLEPFSQNFYFLMSENPAMRQF
jgi:hypothetical protein